MSVRPDFVMTSSSIFSRFFIIFFLVFAVVLQIQPVMAQSDSGVVSDIQPLIDSAKENGVSIIVITPEDEEKDIAETGPSLQEQAVIVRTELRRILPGIFQAPGIVWGRILQLGDGSALWLLIALGIAVVGIAVGTVPSIFIGRWLRDYFRDHYNLNPETRAEKIGYLMFRGFMILLTFLIMTVVASTIGVILDTGHPPTRTTVGTIIIGYTIYRIFRHVFFFNLFAHDVPNFRMVNLDDEEAERIQRKWRRGLAAVVVLCSFFIWIFALGLRPDALKVLVIASLGLSAVIVGVILYQSRKELEKIILGAGDPTEKPTWRRWLAKQAYLLIILYAGLVWAVSAARIALDKPSSLAIMGSPILAILGWVVGYSLIILIIDRFYSIQYRRFEEKVRRAREQNQKRLEAERQAEASSDPEERPEDDEELIISEIMSAKEIEEMPVFKPIFKDLFEQAAGILMGILAFGFLLGTWDVNLGQRGNPVTEFIDTLAIIFIGWFLYRAVVDYVDHQLTEEGIGVDESEGELGDEGGAGKKTSRIGTLLPLLRNVFVVTIIVLCAMIILSNAGVDIAPLFAGAGVLGLAVGFGAQTLIRDIFSGGFFLFDDAFRKGEYIEMGDIRGTVEKISLRSFQLRHHNGPLHTIPFGEIKQLTNYSRDWVMMKLPLRLTYDTDVERVRKLVKKLGQRLLDHPEVGHLFLQPLKSQGVYKMEDSAMIIRVKFMTRPGDQFVTRKVVYASIRDLFEQEDIKFANREVTVHLAEDPNRQLTENEKRAVTSAAQSVIDEEAAKAAGPQKADDGL